MSQKGVRVLWIDDEVFDNEVRRTSFYVNGLVRAGLTVSAEKDPSVALVLLKSEAFDVILLDIMMAPGDALVDKDVADGYSTGLVFLDELRKQGCVTPVVIFTIKAISLDKEYMTRLNVKAILAKPMDADKLAEAIRDAIK